jgi:hypothetical protein
VENVHRIRQATRNIKQYLKQSPTVPEGV